MTYFNVIADVYNWAWLVTLQPSLSDTVTQVPNPPIVFRSASLSPQFDRDNIHACQPRQDSHFHFQCSLALALIGEGQSVSHVGALQDDRSSLSSEPPIAVSVALMSGSEMGDGRV